MKGFIFTELIEYKPGLFFTEERSRGFFCQCLIFLKNYKHPLVASQNTEYKPDKQVMPLSKKRTEGSWYQFRVRNNMNPSDSIDAFQCISFK